MTTTLTKRLDTVFELRAMPTRALRKQAIRRGVRANGDRVSLMRGIYWDVVRQVDAEAEEQAQAGRVFQCETR